MIQAVAKRERVTVATFNEVKRLSIRKYERFRWWANVLLQPYERLRFRYNLEKRIGIREGTINVRLETKNLHHLNVKHLKRELGIKVGKENLQTTVVELRRTQGTRIFDLLRNAKGIVRETAGKWNRERVTPACRCEWI